MAIHKFIGNFKKPLNFNVNSPQGIEWSNATIETHPHYYGVAKYVYDDLTNSVYRNFEKHQIGVIHTKIVGGKWEKVSMKRVPGKNIVETFDRMKERLNLKPSSFVGQPRIKGFES